MAVPTGYVSLSALCPARIQTNITHQLNNFSVGISTSPFIHTSNFGAFIFFGCVTLIAVLYVWFFVPETNGRTLEEMDELFGSTGMAVEDAALKARIEREIGLLALLGEDGEHGLEEEEKAAVGGTANNVEDVKTA